MKAGELWTLGTALTAPGVQAAELSLQATIWVDRVLTAISKPYETIEKRRIEIAAEHGRLNGNVFEFDTPEKQIAYNKDFAALMEEDIGEFEIPRVSLEAVKEIRIRPGMFWAVRKYIIE